MICGGKYFVFLVFIFVTDFETKLYHLFRVTFKIIHSRSFLNFKCQYLEAGKHGGVLNTFEI